MEEWPGRCVRISVTGQRIMNSAAGPKKGEERSGRPARNLNVWATSRLQDSIGRLISIADKEFGRGFDKHGKFQQILGRIDQG